MKFFGRKSRKNAVAKKRRARKQSHDKLPQTIVYKLDKPQSDPSQAKKIKSLADSSESFRKLLINSIIILIIVLLFIGLYTQLDQDVFIIESFAVSKQLEKMGYSGEKIEKEIYRNLELITKESLREHEDIQIKINQLEIEAEIIIPGTKTTLKKLIMYLKSLFGYKLTRISGVFILEENSYKLIIRSKKKRSAFIEKESEKQDLEGIFRKGAISVLNHTYPLLITHYLFNKTWDAQAGVRKDTLKAELEDSIEEILDYYEDESVLSKIHYFYGLVSYYFDEDYIFAKRKLEDSIKKDPKFPNPHLFLGKIHKKGGEFAAALCAYYKVTKLAPEGSILNIEASNSIEEIIGSKCWLKIILHISTTNR